MRDFEKKHLPNGIRLIVAPMGGTEAATLYVLFGTGSRFEPRERMGLAHFLEHMFFKGTKKRPKARLIAEEIDALGARANAFTGEEYTGFWIQAEARHFSPMLDLMIDLLENPTFPREELEREKGVVLEEINMYRDTPMEHVEDVAKELLFGGTPLGWPIIGKPETVRVISRKNLLEFISATYDNDRLIVGLAGKVGEREVRAVSAAFSRLRHSGSVAEAKIAPSQDGPGIAVEERKTDQVHLILGIRALPRGHKDRYTVSVLEQLLAGGMASRLFQRIREELGLAYYVNSIDWRFADVGFLGVQMGVPPARVEEAISATLVEFSKLREKPVPDKELRRVKDAIRGRLALRLEQSLAKAQFLVDQWLLLGVVRSFAEEVALIEAVSTEAIQSLVSSLFHLAHLNLACVGPVKSSKIRKLLHFPYLL